MDSRYDPGRFKNGLIGAGGLLLLTFLFVQRRPVDSAREDRIRRDWRRMKQLDAEINFDLLGSRYDLLRSYDPFVQKLDEIRAAQADLEQIPSFIRGRRKTQLEQLLNRGSAILSEKARLVETFKSENAVLKNSLRYFPVLMAETSLAAAKDPRLEDRLAILLRDILLYDLTPHSDLTGALNAEVALLSGDPARRPRLKPLRPRAGCWPT
jgi:hypothetical protein